jgi:hypothetical protein
VTTSFVLVAALVIARALADDAAFVEGRRLYEASEYEQAMFRFQEAALVTERPPAERAQVFMWLGLAYAGLGDAESARRAFRDAIRVDGAVAVPIEISPKVEAEIAAVREEVRAAKASESKRVTLPPPTPPAVANEGGWVLPVVVGVAGAACVAGGVVSAGLAASSHARANDLETFQDEVPDAIAARDTQAVVAVGLAGVGVALLGGSAFFALSE